MKYGLSFVGLVLVCLSIFVFGKGEKNVSDDYLRIHIIANSNSVEDQKLKYDVKDTVTQFLSAELKNAQNFEDAKQKIEQNLPKITAISNDVLKRKGVSYFSNCFVSCEEIPARAYDNLVLGGGKYQTLVIKLGDAEGDNWWCVVFPNVCFAD